MRMREVQGRRTGSHMYFRFYKFFFWFGHMHAPLQKVFRKCDDAALRFPSMKMMFHRATIHWLSRLSSISGACQNGKGTGLRYILENNSEFMEVPFLTSERILVLTAWACNSSRAWAETLTQQPQDLGSAKTPSTSQEHFKNQS